jgi:hypothetical protein
MTATFTDYVAQKDAQNTIQLNVTKYSLMLCDALQQNHQRQYPNSGRNYSYALISGRKYHKVMQCVDGQTESVHAFIDKKTGEVYKAASYKAPAKGVRYDLRLIEQREWLFENADWAGSYLYSR